MNKDFVIRIGGKKPMKLFTTDDRTSTDFIWILSVAVLPSVGEILLYNILGKQSKYEHRISDI